MPDSIRKQVEKRFTALEQERLSFIPHYKDLSNFIRPRLGRFLSSDRNKGGAKNNNIIDNTGTLGLRVLSAGLMSGITSPSRPWFKLETPDLEMMEFNPVKIWLSQVERILRRVFLKSNLYRVLPQLYSEIGLFGTAAMIVREDFKDVIRCYPMTAGEYMIALDERLVTNTIYYEAPMSVGQAANRFGVENLSDTAQKHFRDGKFDEWLTLVNGIEPNVNFKPDNPFSEFKPTRSVWYEKGSTGDKLLENLGFEEFPAMTPRWFANSGDIYGTDCPAMSALGDIKQLQIQQKRKAQGIDKLVNPPMVADANLQNKRTTSLPGDVTFVPGLGTGGVGFKSAYQINLPLGELKDDMRDVQGRINSAFYVDLFLMLANTDRREITAREVEEKHSEKLLMLGPVLEGLNAELLDPLIERTFSILLRNEMLPPAPQELAGVDLKVQYISILAQAQQSVGIGAVRELMGHVIAASQIDPNAIDKFNTDQSIDEMRDMLGTSPNLVRTDDEAGKIRTARAEAQREADAKEDATRASQNAKTLSEAKIEDGNALSEVVQGAG